MDDFGNELWLVQEEAGTLLPDMSAVLFCVLYFYGMQYGPDVYDEPLILPQDNPA